MNAILDALMRVLDEEHALAVIEHRRVTIKKPLTAFAAKILAKRLAEWGDANQAAEIMIERVWQGFQADWVRYRASPRNYAEAARKIANEPAGVFSTRNHDEQLLDGTRRH